MDSDERGYLSVTITALSSGTFEQFHYYIVRPRTKTCVCVCVSKNDGFNEIVRSATYCVR